MMMWFFLMAVENLPLTSRFKLPPITGPAIALMDVANTVMPRMIIDAVNSLAVMLCGVMSP
ncbi:hypothetical protein D3C87_2131460 [compost metagenome]